MSEPHLESLRRLLAGGRVSHAYLITGSGRAEFAQAMAAALVCQGEAPPCGRCAACKKSALNIHPDIITLSPAQGKREIVVEQIRELRADAYICPNEAGRKIYLIDPASSLNVSAQNALLKVLEEGPPYVVFLLLSETAGALLPTVRSRCEELTIQAPVEEPRPLAEQAEPLAELLLAGNEQALLSFCVELEKLSREEFCVLLEDTLTVLEGRLRQDVSAAGIILPVTEHLKKLWDAAQFNAGVGHLAGWLCAGSFQA